MGDELIDSTVDMTEVRELSDEEVCSLVEGELMERALLYLRGERRQLRRVIVKLSGLARRKGVNHWWLAEKLQELVSLSLTLYTALEFQPGRVYRLVAPVLGERREYRAVLEMLLPKGWAARRRALKGGVGLFSP